MACSNRKSAGQHPQDFEQTGQGHRRTHALNVAEPVDDEHERLLGVAHAAEQEDHLGDKVALLAHAEGLRDEQEAGGTSTSLSVEGREVGGRRRTDLLETVVDADPEQLHEARLVKLGAEGDLQGCAKTRSRQGRSDSESGAGREDARAGRRRWTRCAGRG